MHMFEPIHAAGLLRVYDDSAWDRFLGAFINSSLDTNLLLLCARMSKCVSPGSQHEACSEAGHFLFISLKKSNSRGSTAVTAIIICHDRTLTNTVITNKLSHDRRVSIIKAIGVSAA